MNKTLKSISISLFATAPVAANVIHSVVHNNVTASNLKDTPKVKTEWVFSQYLPNFFADRSVNQIIQGDTDATSDQFIYATNKGLFVKNDATSNPILISTAYIQGKGNVDISNYNFHSIISDREGKEQYFVNVTSDEANPTDSVLVLSFKDKNDFSTAKLESVRPFHPTIGDSGDLVPTQITQVSQWTFGIYTQTNGKLGLVWDTNWKGSYNSARVDTFNSLGLDIAQEKYVQLTPDAENGRLFITTATKAIVISNIRAGSNDEVAHVFNFVDAQGNPQTPTNLDAAFVEPNIGDVAISGDEGTFTISDDDLLAAEAGQSGATFTMSATSVPGINDRVHIFGIYADEFKGAWALTSNGLYYSRQSEILSGYNFIQQTNGIRGVKSINDINFLTNDYGVLTPVIATDLGLYIGVEQDIKPEPTPTPTPKPTPSTSDNGLSSGAIAGIVIGGIALAGIGIGSAVYFIRKNK